jgi:hypothetical protein
MRGREINRFVTPALADLSVGLTFVNAFDFDHVSAMISHQLGDRRSG